MQFLRLVSSLFEGADHVESLFGQIVPLALNDGFEAVHGFVSGDVGVGKPESGIFIRALESAQVMPREAIYVGDSLTWDIAGAKSAGMHGVWINRKRVSKPRDATQPDIEITSLRDLIPILGSDK